MGTRLKGVTDFSCKTYKEIDGDGSQSNELKQAMARQEWFVAC
jgi:hypothetical protein